MTVSCSRENWNDDVKGYSGECIKQLCSSDQIENICSGYPYIENSIIPYKIWNDLGCVLCPGDTVEAFRVNNFCDEQSVNRI